MSQQQQPQPESDCLTVLCFKVTSLTQEKAQLQQENQRLNGVLKSTAIGAQEHNQQSQALAHDALAKLEHYTQDGPGYENENGPARNFNDVKAALEIVQKLTEHLK